MRKTIWLILVLALLTASLVVAQQTIYGMVYDVDGVSPVSGADAKVTINGTIEYTTTSLANGSYSVDLSYAVGDSVEVEAIKATRGYVSTTATESPMEVDVTLMPACSDGMDNDGDGVMDAYDWGCYTEEGLYVPSDNDEQNPACSDEMDNDGDGRIDSQDYGCYTELGVYEPYDNDETNPQCSDEMDNDGDCVSDYPIDPGCESVYDNSESPNPPGSLVVCAEDFGPRIWMCDDRVVIDDPVQPGRVDGGEVHSLKDWSLKGYRLVERIENYAFEGEKIEWLVLVMDKNKIEQIEEVVVTLGSEQGPENDVEVECVELQDFPERVFPECNARIDEEVIEDFDDQIMAYYECTLTVETPDSMEGEYFVTVEAIDATGLSATMDENEFWFFNPEVKLSVDGDIVFEAVRPGTIAYSDTVLLGNDAEEGSGVLLDMFISGTDFYDSDNSGARCVITNRLKLGDNFVATGLDGAGNICDINFGDTDDHLCYYATNGAWSTQTDPRRDAEGYVPIMYGDAFTRNFYNDAEIIMNPVDGRLYSPGNVLSPGAEIALTFKLGLPVPCVGDFDDGAIYFWGEAI